MKQFLTLALLSLVVGCPALAQVKTLTIKNIRFFGLSAGGGTVSKTVQIDEWSTDIYTENDIVHVKVIPGDVIPSSSEENVTLGVITATSEKKLTYTHSITLTFDLTDGDVSYPCIFRAGSSFEFLHRVSDTEFMFKQYDTATEVRLVSEKQSLRGTSVIVPIKADLAQRATRPVRTVSSRNARSK